MPLVAMFEPGTSVFIRKYAVEQCLQQKLTNVLRCNPKIHAFEEVDILFNKTGIFSIKMGTLTLNFLCHRRETHFQFCFGVGAGVQTVNS